MAKKTKVRRKRKGFTLPLAVVAGMAPTVIKVWEHRDAGASGMAREAGRIMTGMDFWDGQFNWEWMRHGTLPMLGGMLVHNILGKRLGLNRALSAAGIPFIRI